MKKFICVGLGRRGTKEYQMKEIDGPHHTNLPRLKTGLDPDKPIIS